VRIPVGTDTTFTLALGFGASGYPAVWARDLYQLTVRRPVGRRTPGWRLPRSNPVTPVEIIDKSGRKVSGDHATPGR
jgi:hypothetical protein